MTASDINQLVQWISGTSHVVTTHPTSQLGVGTGEDVASASPGYRFVLVWYLLHQNEHDSRCYMGAKV